MSIWPDEVTLAGEHVTLVPLSQDHSANLIEAANDGELHRLWYTTVLHPDDIVAEIDQRLSLRASGSMLPFAILTPAGTAVGMTTFMNIDADNRRVEVGST